MKNPRPLPSNSKDAQESGATMVEYALLIALLSLIWITTVSLMGEKVSEKFSTISSQI